jgi:hypothetical protein
LLDKGFSRISDKKIDLRYGLIRWVQFNLAGSGQNILLENSTVPKLDLD